MRDSRLYVGTVVHKRLRPRAHALAYRVYTLLIDLDRVGEIARSLRLFGHNHWNAVSLHDRDHGVRGAPPAAGGLAAHARATFAAAGIADAGAQIMLLCYPRVFGYGFNPISVYYGYDRNGRLAGAIYEVNNTFGQRHSYVARLAPTAAGEDPAQTPADAPPHATMGHAAVHAHGCEKQLYVSPFTDMAGRYSFRLQEPGDDVVIGVLLRDAAGPLLKTHFRGHARPLTDAGLAQVMVGMPLLTLKVIGAIHYEAAKLWLKGVPPTAKPPGPRYSTSSIPLTPAALTPATLMPAAVTPGAPTPALAEPRG